jgi:hypothetical protein
MDPRRLLRPSAWVRFVPIVGFVVSLPIVLFVHGDIGSGWAATVFAAFYLGLRTVLMVHAHRLPRPAPAPGPLPPASVVRRRAAWFSAAFAIPLGVVGIGLLVVAAVSNPSAEDRVGVFGLLFLVLAAIFPLIMHRAVRKALAARELRR